MLEVTGSVSIIAIDIHLSVRCNSKHTSVIAALKNAFYF